MSRVVTIGLIVLGVAGVVVACSSAPTASSKTSSKKDAASDEEDDTPPSSSASCGSKTTINACADCCKYTVQMDDQVEGGFFDCVCRPGGTCATQCATSLCSDVAPPDGGGELPAECEQCLDSEAAETACGDQADSACTLSGCKTAIGCVNDSGCFEKSGQLGTAPGN